MGAFNSKSINVLCLISLSHNHSSSISSFDSLRNNNGMPYNFVGHPAPLHYPSSRSNSYQPDQRSLQLFDAENPQRPNPNLMTHFIQVFFERYGQDFNFLSYQDVLSDFWEQRLSLILANCIAAMAVKSVHPCIPVLASVLLTRMWRRHSSLTDFSVRDLHNLAENYIDVAKVCMPCFMACF